MRVHAAIQGFLDGLGVAPALSRHTAALSVLLAILARWLEGQGIQEVEDITIAHLREFILHTQQRPADSDTRTSILLRMGASCQRRRSSRTSKRSRSGVAG